jgi:hypothetical protein
MADSIKPEFMDQILRSANWSMASEAAELALDQGELFRARPAPTPPSLVVPIDVQALYVPAGTAGGETFVRLPMDLTSGTAEEAKPATPFAPPRRRAAGIHLHWALPDGLLRGTLAGEAGTDDDLELRPLPNRWVVLRLTGRRGVRRLDVRGWVVESENGRVQPLEGYPQGSGSGNGPRIDPSELTAVAGGSPNWTAGYDAAINRFAFHDPLTDLDTGEVLTALASYVVLGWWTTRAHDPLSSAYSTTSVGRILDGLSWSASQAPVSWNYTRIGQASAEFSRDGDVQSSSKTVNLETELRMTTSQMALSQSYRDYAYDKIVVAAPRPKLDCVMHGVVYGVPVRGGILKDNAPSTNRIEMTFAPTLETAIASFASEGMNLTTRSQREYIETLVTAVANSSIRNIASPDGIVALDEAEHADGFQAFQGPETYEDILVETSPDSLRGGRGQRSRLAEKKFGKPPKADAIWEGSRRGSTVYKTDDVRASVRDKVYDAYARKDRPKEEPAGIVKRVQRPGPRYHRAAAPVLGLRNYGRNPRFNGDGLHTEDGTLGCRWAKELAVQFGVIYNAADYLPQLTNRSLPEATNRILQHSFLLDGYHYEWASQAIAETVPEAQVDPTRNRLKGELALRFSATDGTYDGTVPALRGDTALPGLTRAQASQLLFSHSLLEGAEPSPVSITAWAQPWSPIWLEWELEVTPGDGLERFTLGMVDFEGDPDLSNQRPKLTGRAPLTSGLARSYQAAITTYLAAEEQRDEAEAGEISTPHARTLAELAEFLTNPDMGSITVSGLEQFWLGLVEGPDGQVDTTPASLTTALREAGLPRLLAAGRLRLTRARLIDSFGRFRTLQVSKCLHPAAHEMTGPGSAKALRQPPRLAVPARLMWRLTDPASSAPDAAEATLNQQRPDLTVNPVAGFVLPDFVDEALEFFDATGAPLGQVMHDSVTGGLTWEGGVGREGPAVTLPTEGLAPAAMPCGYLAQGMIDADTAPRADPATADGESPLSAFLRAVDTTSWTVEGNLNLSGASIAGLVGRPVAVVTARLRLDIPDDITQTGAYGPEGEAIRAHMLAEKVHDKLKSLGFPIRLGEISKAHDGLYGYFINNDYAHFHLVEHSVATATRQARYGEGFRTILGAVRDRLGPDFLPAPSPLDCPYISSAGELTVHNGQIVRLTLLMHPYARIHATSGILPRKSLELLRDWVAPGLEKIAPSARIGPVLIDPDKIRLPKIAAYGSDQSWTRRDSPITWRDDPILSATQAALLPEGRVTAQEGYIRLAPKPDDSGDGS